MLQQEQPDADVGVIIGRFQTPELHQGHTDLIDTVLQRHNKVLILIGSTPGVLVTRRNPLDFITRKMMIQKAYDSVAVLPIKDMPSDDDWSRSVDERIEEAFGDHVSVILYGSRDAFIPHYSGKHQTIALANSVHVSGTEARQQASNDVRATSDFRRGVVYAAHNRHPSSFPTVDIVMMKYDDDVQTYPSHIAVGRKSTDIKNLWRFPGGFVDPRQDESLEAAAKRELSEEFGNPGIEDMKYLTSMFIDDWRYQKEIDGIMTSVFTCRYTFGPLTAGDDLSEARWVPTKELKEGNVRLVKSHQKILDKVIAHLEKEQS